MSLDVVVGVGPAEGAEAQQSAAPPEQEQAQQDVQQRGGPEGKQVQRLVAVWLHGRGGAVVVGLVDGVDPHISCRDDGMQHKKSHLTQHAYC